MERGTEDSAKLAQVKSFYDEVYYAKVANDEAPDGHLRRLAARLGIEPGDRVLDVACGTGEWLRAAQARGAAPAGIDLSSRAIAECERRMPEGRFFCGPAETLPFADQEFDWVTCLGSLEHFVRPEDALREMVRVAKPAATFVLLVPNADFLTRKLGLYHGTQQTAAIETVRSLEAWQALFQRGGLEVVSRWKDLHMATRDWLFAGGILGFPLRALQVLMLAIWPLSWQYQVYHLCKRAT